MVKRILLILALLITIAPEKTDKEAKPMAVTVKEWVQREWAEAGVGLFREKGDFDSTENAVLTPQGHIKRAPAWTNYTAFPTAPNFSDPRGALYDITNQRLYIIGTQTPVSTDYLGIKSLDAADWSHIGNYSLTSATGALGGLAYRNALSFQYALYLIGADANLYYGDTAGIVDIGLANVKLITAYGDRIYATNTAGQIYRLNDAGSGMEQILDTIESFQPDSIRMMTAFRGHLIIAAMDQGGTTRLYQLSPNQSSPTLYEIGQVPGGTGDFTDYGCLFTQHRDNIYFSTGIKTQADGTKLVPIHKYNGSRIEFLTEATVPASSADAIGLLSWKEHLILYSLNTGENATQTLKLLSGNTFSNWATVTTDALSGFVPMIFSISEHLVITANSASNEGEHHTDPATLQDGHLLTSRLDMGHPGKVKVLDRITVILDDLASDFKIVVKYRVDDTSAWTTATTGNNTRRVTIADLNTEFYLLQLRIELDDDTGNNEDIGIEALSVIYTVDG